MRGLIDLLGILFSDFVVFNIRGIVIDDDTEGKTGLRVGARQGADVLDFGSVHIDLYQGVAGYQAVDGFDLLVIIHQHIIQNGKACQRLQCGDQVVGTVDSDQHTLCRPGGDLGDLVIGEVQISPFVDCQKGLFRGAGDRDRTGTILSYRGILSPVRLPVPPHRQGGRLNRPRIIVSHFRPLVNTKLGFGKLYFQLISQSRGTKLFLSSAVAELGSALMGS